jgi:hypothetical protein
MESMKRKFMKILLQEESIKYLSVVYIYNNIEEEKKDSICQFSHQYSE